jgi:hypothetical protein
VENNIMPHTEEVPDLVIPTGTCKFAFGGGRLNEGLLYG